ncbi:SART-1 protein [Cunninghamella echinulata]|nr:SART-1 protein [Cunninghamella echinulata]
MAESISLEETNALRAKLGLPALGGGGEESGSDQEEQHIDKDQQAYENYQKAKEEKEKEARAKEIRDRIERSKNRKQQQAKLKGKGLADDDEDDDSALAWIKKSRQREKQLAEQRAKELEAMDESFESSGSTISSKKKNNVPKYKASDLKGLKVGHDLSEFQEGQETILTLKDRGILDEGDDGSDDELTNVNIEDAERLKKNLETKKQKPGYNPYDDDEFSLAPGEKPSFLPQYDNVDEAGNQKQQKSKGFVLGNYGSVTAASVAATRAKHQASQPQLSVADKLKQVESLDYDKTLHVADYYTQEEMPFKKPKKLKKKKKLRQRTTTATSNKNNTHDDDTNGNMDVNNDNGEEEEEEDIKLPYQVPEDANFVDDDDLQAALSKSRKEANRLKKKAFKKMTPEDIAKSIAEERENKDNNNNDQQDDENDSGNGGGLILSETTEFLNSVGNVPIYVREQRERRAITPVEDEDEDDEEKDKKDQDDMSKRTSMVDTDDEVEAEKSSNAMASDNTPPVPAHEEPVIEEEPLVGRGIAATLSLLSQKGFITKANDEQLARDRRIAEQIKWQAESKKREKQMERQRDRRSSDRHRDYDSERQKEREERDRLREFEQRMANYKPDVKLEYIDDQGNSLKTKEAFRFMSHKFHGKTSGKGKTEKRLQKMEEERKLNMMSSTDTPLNLAGALLERQQKTGNAHVVLSVGNRGVVPTDAAKELGVKRSLDQSNTPNKKR